jgi:hypothetical protein
MNRPQKRLSPPTDATPAAAAPSKKPKILTTPSGIALPQKHWFDPWNSSATGHQRAENNLAGSTSWRESRNNKLSAQYHGVWGGGKRVADTVGAGSEDFGKDGRKVNGDWRKGARGLRGTDQKSLLEYGEKNASKRLEESEGSCDDGPGTVVELHNEEDVDLKKAIAASLQEQSTQIEPAVAYDNESDERIRLLGSNTDPHNDLERAIAASIRDQGTQAPFEVSYEEADTIPPSYQMDYDSHTAPDDGGYEGSLDAPKQIFQHLVFYINGSTAPLVSDHRLKYLISLHGGSLSISHMRKAVTHVIIGNPHNHLVRGEGAGGALSGTKIQKEIARTRGKSVKFVSAGWVMDSVKAGKRVSEAKYENVKVGGAGQGSVFDKFRTAKPGIRGVDKRDEDINNEELGI